MNVVILQPSYIPWRGYFDQIRQADIFVFYDDVQYDKHGWRNRNLIKTPHGAKWLTIPVLSAGVVSGRVPINQIRINRDKPWQTGHWATLRQSYSKSPHFDRYAPLLSEFYRRDPLLLADFTIELTIALSRELGINRTSFVRSSALPDITGTRTDRLLSILQQLGATRYLSGPSAQSYLEEEKLATAGIELEYITYNYPEYRQLYPPYDPQVSILDLLFMVGPDAPHFIWQGQE